MTVITSFVVFYAKSLILKRLFGIFGPFNLKSVKMANQTISFRLSDEYQAIFNKLHEQACEANGSPISKVTFLEKVLDFYSSPKVKEVEVLRDTPETTSKLEELQNTIEQLQSEKESLLVRLQDYESKLDESNVNTARLQSDYNSKQEDYLQQITELEQKVNNANARTVLDLLPEFTAKLLVITAEKLSKKYNKTVKPIDVLSDMFLRYTIDRYNEWFYKWVVTDVEILETAKSINPEISSIKQIKSIVLK